MTPAVPVDDIGHVSDAQRRFLVAIHDLDDAAVRRDSLLPGWSVAHVIAHVARNADSHVRRSEAAARGEVVEQYPGGYAGRAAEIEATAVRPGIELIADLRASAERLEDVWRSLPEAAWSALTVDVEGHERPLAALPARRWQEVEVHLVDLDIGVTHRDWPDDFVAAWLPRLRAWPRCRSAPGVAALLPPPSAARRWRFPRRARVGEALSLSRSEELAWLYGRLRRDDLPELPPWG